MDKPGPTDVNSFLRGASNTKYTNAVDKKNGQFPVKLGAPDPEDRKWALRNKIITDQGGAQNAITNAGVAVAPESFFDYMDRKSQMDLQANYEAWAFNQATLDTPEGREWWFRMSPWLKDKQVEVLEEQANLQKQMARIKITGPQNEDDLKFIFAYNNGLINVSNKPLYELGDNTGTADKGLSQKFNAGMFNPYSKFYFKSPISATVMSKGTNEETQTNMGQIQWNDPWKPLQNKANVPIGGFKPTYNFNS